MEQTQQPAALPACAAPPPVHPKSFPNGDPDAPLNPPAAKNTDSCLSLHSTGQVMHDYACDGPAPGDIAFRWMHGSVCAATNTDPDIQIVTYNEDSCILRENVCVHWQAPFTYLLFGNRGALLIDTGATPEPEYYPLRETVDALVSRWCAARNVPDIPLTVVLTSGEYLAQNQGMRQFAARPNTTLAPTSLAAMKDFYALSSSWPNRAGKIDLGGRVIEVIPTPGAHKDGVSFYDPYNCFLFTGDLFFPGRIQIANDREYAASLARLVEWNRTHPIKWVLGGHIDMMFVPGQAYPRFASYKPYERLLQMDPSLLADALSQAHSLAGRSGVAMRADYTLLNRVSPDEDAYDISPDLPYIDVSYWLP
jgi:glyoxylase-like metal-dependent hydrolase (beta-lactamase superfamily II)